jgi:glycerol-3-phosphate dehydrogenase
MPNGDFESYLAATQKKFPWIPAAQLYRYVRNYGTLTHTIIGDASDLSGLGTHLGDDIYECELRYLAAQEWARTADDVLWRRSKLGLHLSKDTQTAIAQWFATETKSNNAVKTGEGTNAK